MANQINPKQAVDLDAVKLDAKRREDAEQAAAELREKQALDAAQAQAVAWAKAMRRAFKGSGFTHKTRMRWLEEAARDAQ